MTNFMVIADVLYIHDILGSYYQLLIYYSPGSLFTLIPGMLCLCKFIALVDGEIFGSLFLLVLASNKIFFSLFKATNNIFS